MEPRRRSFIVVIVWLVLAGVAAGYGLEHGFEFWPLFFAGMFIGFPLVVLGVALAAGIRPQPPDMTRPRGRA